jgi:hypothetical protein
VQAAVFRLSSAPCSLDHPVRLQQHSLWNRQPDLLSRREIDYQLELGRSFNGKSAGLDWSTTKQTPPMVIRTTRNSSERWRMFFGRRHVLNAEIIKQGYGHALTRYPFWRMESLGV